MDKKTLILVTVLGLGLSLWVWLGPEYDNGSHNASDRALFTNFLDGDPTGFSGTDIPWDFRFPRDHGAHPEYKSESWYLTGYLLAAAGRRFGFQLTFIRLGLKPPDAAGRASDWGTREIYRAHFALTDVGSGRFHASERFSRAALGLSGSERDPVRVWLENWEMEFECTQKDPHAVHVKAAIADIDLELDIRSLKPAILSGGNHGARDQRTMAAGFYSYMLPRLHGKGRIRLGKETFRGKGIAWLDRAWGHIPVPIGPIVWDRFRVHLEDGSEVMASRLRRRTGGGRPVTTGVWIRPDGLMQRFGENQLTINILDSWKNPKNDTVYPARWRLVIPGISMQLEIVPEVSDQVVDHSIPYWGGMVRTDGELNGNPVAGQGFVELTGYRKR